MAGALVVVRTHAICVYQIVVVDGRGRVRCDGADQRIHERLIPHTRRARILRHAMRQLGMFVTALALPAAVEPEDEVKQTPGVPSNRMVS